MVKATRLSPLTIVVGITLLAAAVALLSYPIADVLDPSLGNLDERGRSLMVLGASAAYSLCLMTFLIAGGQRRSALGFGLMAAVFVVIAIMTALGLG